MPTLFDPDLTDALCNLDPSSPTALLELAGELQADLRKARAVVLRLTEAGRLTRFQADFLLQGRGSELILGPYLLLDRLGEGAMGHVYLARHRLLDRRVALKVLRKDRLDRPDALFRFRREAQAAARLAHPNIVAVHDAGEIDGQHYLAMEYVAGIDLAQMLKQEGRLPFARACAYMRQVALGLAHIHAHGLVHRDIKPANLMVAMRGEGARDE